MQGILGRIRPLTSPRNPVFNLMPRRKKRDDLSTSAGDGAQPNSPPKRTRRPKRSTDSAGDAAKLEPGAAAPNPDSQLSAPDLGLKVGVTFRGRGAPPVAEEAKPAPKPLRQSPKREKAPRQKPQPAAKTSESKNRKRESFKPKKTGTAASKDALIEERPAIPNRFVLDFEPVPCPEGAPRIIKVHGVPVIVHNKQLIPPMMFFGNPRDEVSAENCFDQIRKAAANGIHLHSLMLELPVEKERAQESYDFAGYLLKRVVEVDPAALVIFRLVFAGGPKWTLAYPNAVYRYADGSLAEPSLSDESFWGDAQRLLGGFVRGLSGLPHAEHVIGLHLDRGEWFQSPDWGYDTSQAGEDAFRDWCRFRYGNSEVALQAAWFDARAQFDTLRVPDYSQYPLSGEGFLRAQRKERKWVDYHLFLSDATVARIHRLAHEAKVASEGRLLVGVSYGYTFEWSHPASGHLSLGKLLRCREVDFIGGPPSYRDRGMGGTAAFPGPIDSFALNGKLYISEEDFKTPISKGREPDEFNPVLPTPQALEAAHWRGLGNALVHSTGIAWMDLWGNGWLNTNAIWQRASKVKDALQRSLGTERQDPDVAVLIDERSLAYLSDMRAFKLLVQNSREAVLRAGVSAGFYLLSDLAHRKRFPEAKLYIFLNAWDLRPEVRDAIKTRLQRSGKTLAWIYSAGLFENGRSILERVREVTGIAIRPQPFASKAGTTILNRKHPLTELLEERALSTVEQLEPSYFAIPEEGSIVLGEYTQTGLPSFVIREVKGATDDLNWTTVFLGEPIVNEKIIRGLCTVANVQVWNYHGDVVHVRPPYLAIHYTGAGHRTAVLPDRWNAHDLVTDETISEDSIRLRSEATDGATQLLIVGEEADVKRVTSIEAESLKTLEELPEPEDDTIVREVAQIESPIIGSLQADEFLTLLAESMDTSGTAAESEETPPKPTRRRSSEKKPARSPRRGSKEKQEPPGSVGVVFREKS